MGVKPVFHSSDQVHEPLIFKTVQPFVNARLAVLGMFTLKFLEKVYFWS